MSLTKDLIIATKTQRHEEKALCLGAFVVKI
jgi:hypothetical protein